MLDANLKTQLAGYLERLVDPVVIEASLDQSPASAELHELLREVSALSPQLALNVKYDAAERQPSFAIARQSEPARVRFAGLPLGHEFTSLVLALLHAGGHPPKISADLIEQIGELNGEAVFETFISLSCQNCPEVVQALNLIAALNPNVRHTMIDGALHQSEVERRRILAVPAVFLNGEPFSQGRIGLREILAKLNGAAGARARASGRSKAPFDVLIVGGGPAGSAAAIYAARKGVRTAVIAERLGGQVLDTLGIENLISVKETDGPKLARALEEHVRNHEVDVVDPARAEALVPGELIEVKLATVARSTASP